MRLASLSTTLFSVTVTRVGGGQVQFRPAAPKQGVATTVKLSLSGVLDESRISSKVMVRVRPSAANTAAFLSNSVGLLLSLLAFKTSRLVKPAASSPTSS